MCRSWSNLWSHLYGWICIWVSCITICITICVIFNLFGVRTICPTPNREGNDMIWECRIQRKGERVERVGVRACVGVGGRVNKKNIWAKGYQKCLRVQLQHVSTWNARSQHYVSFRPKGWFHFSIVTAHKFFVLPNNHPFNHNLSKACSQCRT